MFSEMISALADGVRPDGRRIRQRFDAALIKKRAVVRLPPAFWVNDAKINPRTDHLLWAALLTGDRQRIEEAFGIVAAEVDEKNKGLVPGRRLEATREATRLFAAFFDAIGDAMLKEKLRRELAELVPEWLLSASDVPLPGWQGDGTK